jgi:urocanate hydratase
MEGYGRNDMTHGPTFIEQPLALNQRQVLLAYTALCALADETAGWGGKLVLFAGFGEQGMALALGTTLAGAACLGVDAQPEHIKQALRLNCCDFLVNHLEEALRILKNEVRKRRPVSVGLAGNVEQTFAAMVERGVLPDLLAVLEETDAGCLDAVRQFAAMGVRVLRFDDHKQDDGWQRATAICRRWCERDFALVRWMAQPGDWQGMQRLDQLALAQMGGQDGLRRRWLEQAPKYFRRSGPPQRWLWMREEEKLALDAALSSAGLAIRAEE